METKCQSSLNIRDQSNILVQFNVISIQFCFLLFEAHLEEEIICFWVWKKVGENTRNTGKVREFLERKKVGTLYS